MDLILNFHLTLVQFWKFLLNYNWGIAEGAMELVAFWKFS